MGCAASFLAVKDTPLLTGVRMSSPKSCPPYLPVGIDQYLLSVITPYPALTNSNMTLKSGLPDTSKSLRSYNPSLKARQLPS